MNRLFVVITIVLVHAHLSNAKKADSAYEQKRNSIARSWNKQFSSKVDFLQEGLFNSMIAVGVKPLAKFENFQGMNRKDWLKAMTNRWMQRFFKEPFRPTVEPSKYYVQKTVESSVLFYQWQVDDYELSMYESVCAVLLKLSRKDGQAVRPNPDEFAKLIASLLNLDVKQDQLTKLFKLNTTLEDGDVVTSARDLSSIRYVDWRKEAIIFGSQRGVCLLLLKAAPGRAGVNLPIDPKWLVDGLVDAKKKQP